MAFLVKYVSLGFPIQMFLKNGSAGPAICPLYLNIFNKYHLNHDSSNLQVTWLHFAWKDNKLSHSFGILFARRIIFKIFYIFCSISIFIFLLKFCLPNYFGQLVMLSLAVKLTETNQFRSFNRPIPLITSSRFPRTYFVIFVF